MTDIYFIRKLYLFFLVLFISNECFSQDTIVKVNKDTIQAKILEVGISEIKYKRFDNPEGPIFVIPKSDILLIRYVNGGTDNFNVEKDNSPIPASQIEFKNPEGLTAEELKLKGQKDATRHYDGYKGAGTGTLVTSLISPALGLIPAIACASTKPKPVNLNYPDPQLMNNYSYKAGYVTRAKKIKQGKAWTNWSIGFAVNIIIVFAVLR